MNKKLIIATVLAVVFISSGVAYACDKHSSPVSYHKPEVEDVCPNLPGSQQTVPTGLTTVNGECVPLPQPEPVLTPAPTPAPVTVSAPVTPIPIAAPVVPGFEGK